jgi:murein hydrolase activator
MRVSWLKITVCVFSLILVIPIGFIDTRADELTDRLKQIQNDMEKTQRELDNGEKKLQQLKTQEKKSVAEIDLIEKNMESVSRNLNAIKNEERTITRRIEESQNRYDDTCKNLENNNEIYKTRLRAIYKRQKTPPAALLLGVRSTSGMMRGLVMFHKVAVADIEVLNNLRIQTSTLDESMDKLRKSLDAKRQLSSAKQKEQVNLANSRVKKQSLLNEIKQDEAQQAALNKKHSDDLANARSQYEKVIRDREKKKTPVAASLKNYNFTTLKGKLPWPVNGRVVSTFGRQVDPRTKTITTNRGIEIETKMGEPVLSIGRGEVIMTQYLRGYGNFVMINHPPGYYSIYGHLSDILVTQKQIVHEGEIIGTAGTTGMIVESAPRLVLEILREETPENPLSWLQSDSRRVEQ